MIKKVLSYFFIVFGLVALWASTSRTAMQYVADHRDVNKWWGTYQCLNGDLVSMSYLDFVKEFNPGPDPTRLKRVPRNGKTNTVLYLVGDSYTWHTYDTNFAGIDTMYYINRAPVPYYYHLDTTKRNIMVIEIAERGMNYFETLQMFDEFKDSVKKTALVMQHATHYASVGFPKIDDLFNRYINQNLQCNLFNYQFIIPMFEAKAALNYYLFNRASGDVVISDNRNFLLLRQTVSNSDPASSYYPVSPERETNIVNNLNAVYDHYRQAGFDEVYFSVIPNPATILQPRNYNNLIPMVQNDPRLKVKVLDIYSVFKSSPVNYYQHGDTHWNMTGKQLWVDMVNKMLTNNGSITQFSMAQ